MKIAMLLHMQGVATFEGRVETSRYRIHFTVLPVWQQVHV
jgi:hypothetical protein